MARSLLLIAAAGCATAGPTDVDFPDAAPPSADARIFVYLDAPDELVGDDPAAADAALAEGPADATAADAAPCIGGDDAAVDPTSGHCYVLFTQNADWNAADAACRAGFGQLVTITAEPENAFVDVLADGREVWMGASDRASEDLWTWSTGEPFTFTNWDGGQPDNGSGSEDCAFMRSSGRWNDEQCGRDLDYVCEREPS